MSPQPLQLLDTSSKYRSYFCYKQRVFHSFFIVGERCFRLRVTVSHATWSDEKWVCYVWRCSVVNGAFLTIYLLLICPLVHFCSVSAVPRYLNSEIRTFKGLLSSYPYIVPLSCIPITGQESTLTWCDPKPVSAVNTRLYVSGTDANTRTCKSRAHVQDTWTVLTVLTIYALCHYGAHNRPHWPIASSWVQDTAPSSICFCEEWGQLA